MKTTVMTIDQYKSYKNGELTLKEIRTGKSSTTLDDIASFICDDIYGEYGENRINIIGDIGITVLTLMFLPDIIKLIGTVADKMQLYANTHNDLIQYILQTLSKDLIK